MRKIRYSCAMSLDGYLVGTGGEFDWIVVDPDIDFQEIPRNSTPTCLAGTRSR